MCEYLIGSGIGDLDRLIDYGYTDDGQGNGYLVLSRFDHMFEPAWSSESRCGAWNALSIFYNDRQTVQSKIARVHVFLSNIGRLPYREGSRAVEAADGTALSFGIADGPLLVSAVGVGPSSYYRIIIRQEAWREAVIAAAALSAYRHDHGIYPSSLVDLLGDYLDAVPNDPYVDEPLRFVLTNGGADYKLYSIGPNGVDEHGRRAGGKPFQKQEGSEDDVLFGHERRVPHSEPQLELVADGL